MMAAYMLWLVPMEQSMFSYQYASVIADCSFDHVVFQGLLREIKLTAGVIPQFGKVGDWEGCKKHSGQNVSVSCNSSGNNFD